MNTTQNAFNVLPYTSGVTTALSGHTLAVMNWKTSKETGIKRESKCCNMPTISSDELMDSFDVLIPHVRNMLHDTRTAIVREMIEKNPNCLLVSENDISIAACCEYLSSSSESGRMTKESLGNWFNNTLMDTLTLALATRLGVSDEPTAAEVHKIDILVASYKDKLCALAGGKTAYKKPIAISLLKAIELVSYDEDVTARKLRNKLIQMRDSTEPELVDLL